METKKIKQLQNTELTMLQQIALEGEVASLMYDLDSEDDKLYYAFAKLALCEEKYLLVYKNEFSKYLDPSTVDELVRYRYMEIIPTYLYARRYIREVKGMLGSDCGSLRIHEYPVEIVKSKFALVMREQLTYVPATASAILDTICNEASDDVEFLRPLAFALKQEAEQEVMEKNVGYDVKLKILSTSIEKAPVLSLQIEDERIAKSSDKGVISNEKEAKEFMDKLAGICRSVVGAINDVEQSQQEAEKLVYLVKKIDKANGQVVFTKEFDTQKQAADYIKNAVENYPEITKRFNFSVELVEE